MSFMCERRSARVIDFHSDKPWPTDGVFAYFSELFSFVQQCSARGRKQPIDFHTIISLISLVKRAYNQANKYPHAYFMVEEKKNI